MAVGGPDSEVQVEVQGRRRESCNLEEGLRSQIILGRGKIGILPVGLDLFYKIVLLYILDTRQCRWLRSKIRIFSTNKYYVSNGCWR